MVVAGTELEKWYRDGHYQPYDDETMINLIIKIKSIVPRYVRISRVLRDIPAKFIVGGLRDSLRDLAKQRMKQQAIECRCIRCREYGHRIRDNQEIGKPRLVRMDYETSGGKEVFLSFEDENETLFGLIRMRIEPQPPPGLDEESQRRLALVRELHVFGPEVPLRQQAPNAAQHKGLGKALLIEAERLAKDEFGVKRIAVLSGVGAKEYYRTEFGYSAQGDYMIKSLRPPQSVSVDPPQDQSDGLSRAALPGRPRR
jgi:elongator complex protein 3